MPDSKLENLLDLIRSSLREYRYNEITGANLRRLILQVAPDFDIRAAVEMPTGPALTTFANRFLSSDVRQIGFRGQDVLFEITCKRKPSTTSLPPNQGDVRLWKTFASYRSEFRIEIGDDGKLYVERQSLPNPENKRLIKSVEKAELDEIQESFRNNLDAGARERLDEVTEGASDYGTWIRRLNELAGDLSQEWSRFRIAEIKKIFLNRLLALGIDDAEKELFLNQLEGSQHAGNIQRKLSAKNKKKAIVQKPAMVTEHADGGDVRGTSNLNSVRQIAKATIDEMEYAAIRELRVPLGAVLDAKLISN